MSEERTRRLSQVFEPLSRFTDLSGAGFSASVPSSPQLMPRRAREPPPPPPRPLPSEGGWQERCAQLQRELHRCRAQAARGKDALRDKLSELEQRVLEAEGRAEEAEDKVRAMEQRLCEWPAGADGAPRAITRLEGQIEEQKQLRLADAKQVEAKAARIKEWVTNKLRELEVQNQQLREQNDRCNQQLELLRNHIANQETRNSALPLTSSEPHYSTPARHRRNLSVGAGASAPHTMSRALDERNASSMLAEDLAAAVQSLAVAPATPADSDADATHDYAEIYTPSRERTPAWQPTTVLVQSRGGSSTADSASPPRAPTPPLHRFPSWEAKIYQVADDGLQQSVGDTLSPPPTRVPESSSYQDVSVPVYATVKGRASQIRSMPFTGDSSDSSDGEESAGGPHTPLHAIHAHTLNNVNLTGQLPASLQQTSLVLAGTSLALARASSSDTSLSASSPSKSVKTSSSLSPAKRSSSGSPSKSKTRDTSFESTLSDDYAIPPDAVSCEGARRADSPRRADALEKSGHLAKLGGKLKTWRKRWFVLKNGTLTYWKSQSETARKPQGQIALGEACRISRNQGANTFEIYTGDRTYYLTADSIAAMEDWIRVLQNVQRRNATKLLLSKEDHKPTLQGWLTKVKNGHSKRSWCALIGKMFLYFKTQGDASPVGQINMRDARVEEVESASDSDSEDRGDTRTLTVAIYPQHQGPTYLLFESKTDKDAWLYQLTVVSGGRGHGTPFEQIVQKLMETDGDPNCVLWRHPTLLYSKENITSPLTSLNSEALQAEALKLFKCVQLFMSVCVEQAGIDYHVVLAQNALQQCVDVPELQDELVACLARQSTPHAARAGVQVTPAARRRDSLARAAKLRNQLLLCATQSLFTCDATDGKGDAQSHAAGSPSSVQAPLLSVDCKSNPPAYSFVQGWQLLALAVSLYVPRNNRLLWYLKLHLSRHADSKTECGKYAMYCERALERSIRNGGRAERPSRMEVLSILLKNPYHHCLPHAIPVHFLNDTYQVVSFDGSTTVEEFLATLTAQAGCRAAAASGFALYSDDPIDKEMEHHIRPDKKLCDVISAWETALREKGSGKFENSRVIRLTFRNRLYFRNAVRFETDKERLLMCYQINQQVVAGRFPVSRELAAELGALMAQLDRGDCGPPAARDALAPRYYPFRYRAALTNDETRELEDKLRHKWAALRGRPAADCVRIYLNCTRKWPFFGATLFQARIKQPDMSMVWLAVSSRGVSVLQLAAMSELTRHPLSAIPLFGGIQDDLMMLIDAPPGGAVQKMLISLNKVKMAELTHLIADYKNATEHPTAPGSPLAASLTRSSRPRAASTLPHASAATTLGSHHATLGSHHATLSHATLSHAAPDILKSTPDHRAKKRGQEA